MQDLLQLPPEEGTKFKFKVLLYPCAFAYAVSRSSVTARGPAVARAQQVNLIVSILKTLDDSYAHQETESMVSSNILRVCGSTLPLPSRVVALSQVNLRC
jgi:hypothetical protein